MKKFPAPREVARDLYAGTEVKQNKFPSPLGVDRFLYDGVVIRHGAFREKFPSPLEVDRELYTFKFWSSRKTRKVSGPSQGK